MKRFNLIITLIFIFTSCSREIGQFSVISTRDYNNDKVHESIGRIEGKDTEYLIVIIPTGIPKLDNAVSDALYNYNANYLTNALVTYQEFYIPYLFGFLQFKVVGEGWVETKFEKEINKDSKLFDPNTGELILE